MRPRLALLCALGLTAPACDRVWGLRGGDVDAAAQDGDAIPDAALTGYAAAVLADQPTSYWRFGDGNKPIAEDLAGQSPGTYRPGAAPTASGALVEPDTALSLTGTTSYVSMGARFPFPGRTPFTIELWVKPAAHRSYAGVLSEHDDTGGTIRRGYFLFDDTAELGFNRSDGTLNEEVRTPALPLAMWSYVVVAYDGSLLRLYVDGVVRDTRTSTLMIPTTSMPFVVGARNGGAFGFFQGDIDELAIYPRPLSQAQIDAHRAAAFAP